MAVLAEPRHSQVKHPAHRQPFFVFHWPGWRRGLRDFAIMQVGLVLVALWFTLMRQVGIDHLIPWGIVEHGIADQLSIDIGSGMVVAMVGAVIVGLLLRQTFGWGSVANVVFMTLVWADLLEQILPDLHTSSLAAQLAYVVLAVSIGAVGTAIYLSINAGAGPRDNLMLAIVRLAHVNVGVARVLLEAILVGIGLLLGGSVGWVTLTHMAVAGPAIWLSFRLFRLEPVNEFWGRAEAKIPAVPLPR